MFTGIIECTGVILAKVMQESNLYLTIESPISVELKVDQSVSHNGICLTVIEQSGSTHRVCAVEETINKTTIAHWDIGSKVNIERGMRLGDRLDGHIVQGHVDGMATCVHRESRGDNSWLFRFEFDPQFANLLIEKGSVTLNGTSLTCFSVTPHSFEVAIIPYTFLHTTFPDVLPNATVNIEFDVLGKYILRSQSLSSH